MQSLRSRLAALGQILLPSCVVLAGVALMPPMPPRPVRDSAISEAEAIRLAERFIAENGYTDVPVAPGTKLTPESLELYPTREAKLAARRDKLYREASGAYAFDEGWLVMFRYKQPPNQPGPEVRRGVQMNKSGRGLQMIHQELY